MICFTALPNGINFGTFIGCGGDGVGSGTVGDMVTAAHEAGHAYGRKHAPCDDSARCSNPSNPDDDFPQYGLYDLDSIGEFGFDAESNTVFDPQPPTISWGIQARSGSARIPIRLCCPKAILSRVLQHERGLCSPRRRVTAT